MYCHAGVITYIVKFTWTENEALPLECICCKPLEHIHHIYFNLWLLVYRWSVMDKQVTSTHQYLEMGGGGGGGGVLVTCIYITDHL